jgi:hypothetical protein
MVEEREPGDCSPNVVSHEVFSFLETDLQEIKDWLRIFNMSLKVIQADKK